MADTSVAVAIVGVIGSVTTIVVGGLTNRLSRKRDDQGTTDPLDASPTDNAVLSAALSAVVREKDAMQVDYEHRLAAAEARCQECLIKLAMAQGAPQQRQP